MSKSKTQAKKIAAPTVATPAKEPVFAFSFVGAGHYQAPGGVTLKRLESGAWNLSQKNGAVTKQLGEYRTVYDGIRAGKDHAGVEYAIPEKTALKVAMQPAPAIAAGQVQEVSTEESSVEI